MPRSARPAALLVGLVLTSGLLTAPSASAAPVPRPLSGAADVTTTRLAGSDRYGTAVDIAIASFPQGADTVLIASGTSFPDALAAAPLAAHLHAPVLLTAGSATLEPTVLQALKQLGARHLVAVGGADRVSGDALEAAAAATGLTWRRIAGSDRFTTAAALAAELGTAPVVDGGRTAFLATGSSFPDALAAAAPAAAGGLPVLLATGDSVPAATRATLQSAGVERVVLLGSVATLGPAVERSLTSGGFSVSRVAGGDRYETAAAVADWGTAHGLLGGTGVALARGDARGGGADALALAPLAAARRAPLLLTAGPDGPAVATAVWMQRNGSAIRSMTIAGGVDATSDAAVRTLARRAVEGPLTAPCPQGCRVADWFTTDPGAQPDLHEFPGVGSDAVDASVGVQQAVWVRRDGTVWGAGSLPGDGPGGWTQRDAPEQIRGLQDIVQVRLYGTAGLALDSRGALWAWNWVTDAAFSTQYVRNLRDWPTAPSKVSDGVVAFGRHAAVLADGALLTWQTGYEVSTTPITDRQRFTQPEGLTDVGDQVFLDDRGDVWRLLVDGWGRIRPDVHPVPMPGPVAAVSGRDGSVWAALLDDGRVVTWTGGTDGWIGRTPGAGYDSPSLVPGIQDVVSFDTGWSGTYVVDAAGVVRGWGDLGADAWKPSAPEVPKWSLGPQEVHLPAGVSSPVVLQVGKRYSIALFR